MVIASNLRVTGQRDVVIQSRSPANFDVGSDDTVVSYANFFIEFRTWVDNGGMGDDGGHTNQLSSLSY